ncbi:ATP synthase subunit a [Bienertia sinuspersici]
MKIGNLYFSFTNPSLFMLLTLSLVLLILEAQKIPDHILKDND